MLCPIAWTDCARCLSTLNEAPALALAQTALPATRSSRMRTARSSMRPSGRRCSSAACACSAQRASTRPSLARSSHSARSARPPPRPAAAPHSPLAATEHRLTCAPPFRIAARAAPAGLVPLVARTHRPQERLVVCAAWRHRAVSRRPHARVPDSQNRQARVDFSRADTAPSDGARRTHTRQLTIGTREAYSVLRAAGTTTPAHEATPATTTSQSESVSAL